MSEPTSQPGAPADFPKTVPEPSEKSLAKEVEKKMPPKVNKALATPDRLLLRLNKLLAAPGGLSALLSTVNYTLFFLTHLETKTAPLQERLNLLINRYASTPKVTPAVPVGPSKLAALATMLSSARTTLRLFGLVPMYAWARQLSAGPKPGQDQILYMTSVTQCALYITFQFLENVALLTREGVLPKSLTARWTEKSGGDVTTIFTTAYRAWFFGICCDFVRLGREAQLERAKRSQRTSAGKSLSTREEEQKVDQRWWADAIVPVAWAPMGFHFAALNATGFPGWNLGLMGLCGLVAGAEKMKALWLATADV